MTCHDVELSLGVLVLGAIDPTERSDVEAHLATCAHCTALLAELAPLPGLLHRLSPAEAVAPTPQPPPELLDRVLGAARREQRQRMRRRRLVGAVAAAAVLLGVVLGLGLPRLLSDGTPAVQVASATDSATHVWAQVRLQPGDTGTQLALQLTGVSPGERCSLVAVDATGRRDVASTWVASYAGRASVMGHTGFSQDRITWLNIVTTDGRTLVRVPVTASS